MSGIEIPDRNDSDGAMRRDRERYIWEREIREREREIGERERERLEREREIGKR